MTIFTIGFTKKSAEQFFERLREAGVRRVLDIRLNNKSQLAGFAKGRDLKYLLKVIAGIDYVEIPELAPTQDIIDDLKKRKGSWEDYESSFRVIMESREIAEILDKELIDGGCLLCSEHTPEHCHRRLVAEHLGERWGDVEIIHL